MILSCGPDSHGQASIGCSSHIFTELVATLTLAEQDVCVLTSIVIWSKALT